MTAHLPHGSGDHISETRHPTPEQARAIALLEYGTPGAGLVEEWRPVVGYEGMYEVSDLGRVRSLPRPTARGRMMTLLPAGGGYLAAHLSNRDHGRSRPVHILVAAAFHGPRPSGHHVRHLDGDKFNNRRTNLAYGTPSENVQDSIRHGTQARIRMTECIRGHSLVDPANVYRPPGAPTRRLCVQCLRIHGRKTDARRSAERAAKRAAMPPKPPFCSHGHELVGANLYVPPGKPNQRRCVECRRTANRKFECRRAAKRKSAA